MKKDKVLYAQSVTFTMPAYMVEAIEKHNSETNMPKSRIVQNAIAQYLQLEKPQSSQDTQAN